MARLSTNAHVLQWIDRRVGVPVCFVLTCWRRLLGLFGGAVPKAYERILFIKLAEQGSTVLAREAIRQAVTRVGKDNVYFLVFEENRFILDVLGLVPEENVLTIRTKSAWTMMATCLGRLAQIRRMGIEAAVDMEFFARFSSAISYLTGCPIRVGFHSYYGEGPYRGDLLTHRVLYNAHLHTSRIFTTLVLALDADPAKLPTFDVVPPPSPPVPPFQPLPEEAQAVRRILDDLGVKPGGKIVLLNANASDLLPLRRWESANYIALAGKLLAEFPDAWIAFTGAPDEAPKIMELVRQINSPRCVCLAGKTTLRQLLVVYALAEVLITNDSGPAHFASLTNIDVVVLFGPETPLLFAAPGPRTHALWAGLACSPCVNAYNNRQTACKDNRCMKRIGVDEVYESASRILRQRQTASK